MQDNPCLFKAVLSLQSSLSCTSIRSALDSNADFVLFVLLQSGVWSTSEPSDILAREFLTADLFA